MVQVRCKSCTKLLFLANIYDGEVKCRGCKHIAHYTVMSQSGEKKLYEMLHLQKDSWTDIILAKRPHQSPHTIILSVGGFFITPRKET